MFYCEEGTYDISDPQKSGIKHNEPSIACRLKIMIDFETEKINATIKATNLKKDLNDNENCNDGKMKRGDGVYECWYFTSNKTPDVNKIVENLLKKDEESPYYNDDSETGTSTYPDACEMSGLKSLTRKKFCKPGHYGCFLVTDALTLADTGDDSGDDETTEAPVTPVYQSCIGELEKRIDQKDHDDDLMEALLCNTKEPTDECFYVQRGHNYKLVCCCTTQEVHKQSSMYGGQKPILVYRCNNPVKNQFEQHRKSKMELKRVGEFRDKRILGNGDEVDY